MTKYLALTAIERGIIGVCFYYLWNQIKGAWASGNIIVNLGSNLKWTAAGIAGSFTLTSLTLLFYLWKVSHSKSKIAKLKVRIRRLEREMD